MVHFNKKGQMTFEFTFTLIAVIILMYGTIKAFSWVGQQMSDTQHQHDTTIVTPVDESWSGGTPAQRQLNPEIAPAVPMRLVPGE